MKKLDAINDFVRTNFKLLKDRGPFEKKKYKDLKKAYFGTKLKHQFGNPPDKQICDCLVEVIIKVQQISDTATLEQAISESPFLTLNNIKAADYSAIVDLASKKFAIHENVRDLVRIEKEEKLIEWIKKEHTKEIDELIGKKKEEYLSLPSILDDKQFDEPDELPIDKGMKEWWEDLKLRENPFQGPLDGIFMIHESLYNEIIVETPPINWALTKIKRDQFDYFHRGFLLAGEFGTGKTTFFDFVAPQFSMKHVEPLRIALSENISEAHYVQKFEKELCLEIARVAKKYNLSTQSRIVDFDEARVLMIEMQSRGAKGFLIFIDDLHKNIRVDIVFNFLANLQIAKNVLSRDRINAFFIVSGFPNWRTKIRGDSALTGFFDAADELSLPEVTPKLAAQAIKKRLQAFSINPDREISIREEFLTSIFKRVSSEIGRSNIGFRPYIQEAIKHFQEKKFDILSIDFTKLDESLTKNIRAKLESDTSFRKSINRLIFGGGIKKKEVRERTIKVLCEIYLRKGTTERESFFTDNLFYFKQLSDCGLIQKYSREGDLVWNVSKFFTELNSGILGKYGLSMEDYLVPIYASTASEAIETKPEQKRLEMYETVLKSLERNLDPPVIGTLKSALKGYREIIYPLNEVDPKKLTKFTDLPEPSVIRSCIWTMMKAILRFESPMLLDICGENEILGWTLRYRTLEYAQHFISMERNLETATFQKEDIIRLISFANDAFDELFTEFQDSVRRYQTCYVKCYELPRQVLKTLHSEYNNILAVTQPREEYFYSLSRVVEKIEETIRGYLFAAGTLIFGPYHERLKYYPNDIRQYITRSTPSSVVSYESYNEFENLNRGQYRSLFTQTAKSSDFYRYLIGPVIGKWDSHDIETFFMLFGDINIISGHTKKTFVEDARKDAPTLFRLACRLISGMSARLRDLVMLVNSVVKSGDKSYIVFGYQMKINQQIRREASIDEAGNLPECFHLYEVTKENAIGGTKKIIEYSDNVFGSVEVDLLDIEGTRIRLHMNYCESIPLIAYFYASNKLRILPLYGTNISVSRI